MGPREALRPDLGARVASVSEQLSSWRLSAGSARAIRVWDPARWRLARSAPTRDDDVVAGDA